jgi:ABC-type transporter lipoprotein component MlaA
METALQALLVAQCERTFQTVAHGQQTRPYVVWQLVGGRTLRYVANDATDKRNSLVQVSVWADTSSEATTLVRAIEDALCTASFIAEPQGEALATYEEETKLYGAIQRFSITAART